MSERTGAEMNHPSGGLYGRAIVRITEPDGSTEECWYGAYMVDRSEREPLPSKIALKSPTGRWLTIWTPETGWTG